MLKLVKANRKENVRTYRLASKSRLCKCIQPLSHVGANINGGKEPVSLSYKTIDSPVGQLKLVAGDKGLVAILWENDGPKRVPLRELVQRDSHPILIEAERQLSEYFSRQRKSFSVPLDIRGTSFQREVWEALLAIPFGETRSYGDLAKRLGNPRASRAVGAANGRNPLSIIVPCHRVIASTGNLTGFAGGIKAKSYLLDLEQEKTTNE